MAAYLIANVDVHDPAAFARYREAVTPLIAKFGGRYLVRGGAVENKEGDLGLKRLVVLEFPDMAAARAFYDSPEYAPVLKMREEAATSSLALVEGYAG
ncbi:MAG TPA: DUF1330 domain-containing protein [Beijerinckiaceae bacterium]|nr:DUF1330 domain-containing protein [Beijerinckiaceae bacterium]